MNTREKPGIRGQEALRLSLLKELAKSTDDKLLLKEHYDWLQEITSISRKTLRRFFKEQINVGPQTRNLLAAIALGRGDELNGVIEEQKDYYLMFLETLQQGRSNSSKQIEYREPEFRDELCQILAEKYASSISFEKPAIKSNYQTLLAIRKRVTQEDDKSLWFKTSDVRQQEFELTSSILFSHTGSVLLGDAGIGKTTFARNICAQWSHHQSPDSTIPLYIDLKSEAYHHGVTGAVDFLLYNYFGQRMDWALTEFLETRPDDYCFLLDGFDELTPKEKNRLMEELQSFSQGVRYVILSRPYGFGDYDYQGRSIYEIIGLSDIGKEEFLRSHALKPQSEEDILRLLGYLNEHPVLSRLSRSPMGLVKIARLAGSEMLYELLDDVESHIDLQHLYINYVAESIKN